jgi:hypothetical protein
MYHSWAYGLDGKLVAAPNLVNMPDINRTEFGLRRARVSNGSATSSRWSATGSVRSQWAAASGTT